MNTLTRSYTPPDASIIVTLNRIAAKATPVAIYGALALIFLCMAA